MTKGLNKYWALTYILGSKDLELNIQNHYCVVLANRDQNMSSLGVQAMLKKGISSFEVQMFAEKKSEVLPFSTDRKSQAQFLQNF